MRRHYIDNLRWMCVLLLFPYHTFMVFNNFGESFYVKGADIQATSYFIMATWPWIMPLLFLVAGVSSAYALQKRSAKEYAIERIHKLLIPLLFGLLLLAPMQTFFAELFHNGYAGSYLAQYILFFTKPTDLSGYHGGFTPAHLWFILYLFVISMIALPLMRMYKKSKKQLQTQKIPLIALVTLFLVPGFSQVILDISGKSVGEYLAYFLLGFFIMSKDDIQEKLRKYRFLLLGFAVSCVAVYIICGDRVEHFNVIVYEVLYNFYAWTFILAILGFGKQYFNFATPMTAYMSRSSFSVYVFHQQWIVITAYFALMWTKSVPLQMMLIMSSTVVFTFLTYEALKRIPATRFMFGIKK